MFRSIKRFLRIFKCIVVQPAMRNLAWIFIRHPNLVENPFGLFRRRPIVFGKSIERSSTRNIRISNVRPRDVKRRRGRTIRKTVAATPARATGKSPWKSRVWRKTKYRVRYPFSVSSPDTTRTPRVLLLEIRRGAAVAAGCLLGPFQ